MVQNGEPPRHVVAPPPPPPTHTLTHPFVHLSFPLDKLGPVGGSLTLIDLAKIVSASPLSAFSAEITRPLL